MPVQSDFPFFHDYLLFKTLKSKTPNIHPNGKTTEGLVQQRIHKTGVSHTFERFRFCVILGFADAFRSKVPGFANARTVMRHAGGTLKLEIFCKKLTMTKFNMHLK